MSRTLILGVVLDASLAPRNVDPVNSVTVFAFNKHDEIGRLTPTPNGTPPTTDQAGFSRDVARTASE